MSNFEPIGVNWDLFEPEVPEVEEGLMEEEAQILDQSHEEAPLFEDPSLPEQRQAASVEGLEAMTRSAATKDVDEYSQLLDLSRRTGVAPGAFERDPALARQFEINESGEAEAAMSLAEHFPETAELLSNDPTIGIPAFGEYGVIDRIGQTFKGIGKETGYILEQRDIGTQLTQWREAEFFDENDSSNYNPYSGSMSSDMQIARIRQEVLVDAYSRATGEEVAVPTNAKEFDELRAKATAFYAEQWSEVENKIQYASPYELNLFQQGIRMGVSGLATEGPAMAASLIPFLGTALGTSVTYHNSYADHFGRGYASFLEQGYDEEVSAARAESYAKTAATIDGATSLIPLGAFGRVFGGAPGRQAYQRVTGRIATNVGEKIGGRAGEFVVKRGVANVVAGSVPLASQTIRTRLKDNLATFLLSSGIGMQVDSLLLGLNDTWNAVDQEAHQLMQQGDIAGWASLQLDKQLIALTASVISDTSFAAGGAALGKGRDLLFLKKEPEADVAPADSDTPSDAGPPKDRSLEARDPKVKELMDAAAKTKMAKRSPEAYEQTVKSLGGDDVTITLDREAAAELLNSKTKEEIENSVGLSLLQERMEASQDVGNDISFTGTEFVTKIANSDFSPQIAHALTTDEGGMSPYREARNLGEAMEDLLRSARDNEKLAAEVRDVTTKIVTDLIGTGRYTKVQAGAMGKMVAAYIMVKARGQGITPQEALTREGNFLKILGPMSGRPLPTPKGRKLAQANRSFVELEDNSASRKAFADHHAKALEAHGERAAFAEAQTAENLEGSRMFLSDDLRSGYAISPTGEIMGVFRYPEAKGGMLASAIAHARAHGGTQITGLEVAALSKAIREGGFVETSREASGQEGTPDRVTYSPAAESTGQATMGFFEGVARGAHGRPDEVQFIPQITELAETIDTPTSRFGNYHQEYVRHSGHFDDHIAQSIPGYRDFQYAIGIGLLHTFADGGTFLDIGGSQGTQAKSLTSLSGGKIRTVTLDPNLGMRDTFGNISQVEGARFEHGALGFYPSQKAGDVAWVESDGTPVRYWDNKGERFDVVHEAMTFQFISPDRRAHIARTKELLNQDGVAIFQEKVVTDDARWAANEAAKDTFKEQTFSKEDMQEKAETVLTGMKANQVHEAELLAELNRHFKYVDQIWDSGNFKGYAASDSAETMNRLMNGIPDTTTKWDTRNRGDNSSGVRQEDGSLAHLPRVRGAAYNSEVGAVAEAYMQKAGKEYDPPAVYAEVNVAWAEEIAKLYGEMEHRPNDPEVKAAYDAMIEETLAQYDAMLEAGVQIEIMDMAKGDAYGGDPRKSIEDVRDNNHLYIFGTKDGYGQDTVLDPSDNPMVRETKYKDINGVPMLANDVFRAVHDYFGHAKEGVGFRAAGEENAWRAHASMYSPLARRAMTAETRGQNSWVNYGPHGEHNRTATSDTIYADQKVGLLPEWVSEAGRKDDSLDLDAYFRSPTGAEEDVGVSRWSALTQTVETDSSAPSSATATQWREWLRVKEQEGAITAAEIRWAGLSQELFGRRGNVTKEEVLDLLKADSHEPSAATPSSDLDGKSGLRFGEIGSLGQMRAAVVEAVVQGVDQIALGSPELAIPVEALRWAEAIGLSKKTAIIDGQLVEVLEMSDRALDSVLAGNSFAFRQEDADIRGYYYPEENVIRLTDSSNLSTFMHEFAHFMLEAESPGSDVDLRITRWLVENSDAGATEASAVLSELASKEALEQAVSEGNKILADYSYATKDTPDNLFWGVKFVDEEGVQRWYDSSKSEGEKTPPPADRMLVEGATIEAQPEWVSSRLLSVFDLFAPRKDDGSFTKLPSRMTGGEMYQQMALKLGGLQQASEFLKELGISGATFEGGIAIWDNAAMSPTNVMQQDLLTKRLRQGGAGEGDGVTAEQFRRYIVHGTTGDTRVDSALYVAKHELFARAFEAYLWEGKAPSRETQEPMQKISAWMMQVYKSLGELDTPIDPTIRTVFDRLLASDEEIDAAHRKRKLAEEYEASMPEDPVTRKMAANEEEAVISAKEKLRNRIMANLKRMILAERKGQLADIEDEIRPQIEALKVNVARRTLAESMQLDRAAVRELVGETKVGKTGVEYVALPVRVRGLTKSGGEGADPDIAARALGYSSGEEMLSDIVNSPTEAMMLREQSEQILKERHGDPIEDGTLTSMAETILADEMAAKVLLKRISELRRSDARETRRAMKEMAREKIGRMSFRELKPLSYRRAEVRAAREAGQAAARGDKTAEAAALTRQLLAHFMATEAEKARTSIENTRAWAGRYGKTATRREIAKSGGGHLEQIDSILSRFELRKAATLSQVEDANLRISEWAAERMETHGDALVLTAEVLDMSYVTHWKDVPLDILNGVKDSVANIEHVARYSNKVKLAEDTLAFEDVVGRLTGAWEELPQVHTDSRAEVIDRGQGFKRKVAWGMAQLTKMSWLTRKLDKGEPAGFSHEVLMQPFTDAWDKSQKLYRATGEVVVNAIQRRSKEDIKRHAKKHYIPEIEDSLYGSQILSVALNTGNAGNLRKLLLGEGWASPDDPSTVSLENPKLQAVLSRMTESDWKLVQLIWDQMDLLYPELANIYESSTGLRPPKVEATPVQTPFGEIRGGYYPVKYDPNRSRDAADFQDRADAVADSWFTAGGIQASVNASAAETRTGYFAPIRLDLGVVSTHFGETIHFISHHDAVRQTNRLLRDPKVMKTLRERIGPEEADQLMPWLRDIAKQGQEAPLKTFLDGIVQHLTTGATLTYMGFKLSTGLRQLPGFSNSAAEVGWGNIAQGIRAMFRSNEDMQSGMEWAMANSKILPHRIQSFDREVANTFKYAAGKKARTSVDAFRDAALLHIGLIDLYTLALPTWYGAYIKEMKASGDEAKAFRYADSAVEMTQGTARIADTSALLRNNSPVHRSLTMFMSYFSALWNQLRDIREGQRLGYYDTMALASKVIFTVMLPSLLDLWITGGAGMEEDETAGEYAARVGVFMGLFTVAGIPGVRDAASALGTGFEYRLSPIEGIVVGGLDGLLAAGSATFGDEEMSKGDVKGLVRAAMAIAHIPGGSQATATLGHIYDVIAEGEDVTYEGLAYGKRAE